MKIQHITTNVDLGASERLKEECRRALDSIDIAKANFHHGKVLVTVVSPNVPCVKLPGWVDEKTAVSDVRDLFGFSDLYPLVPIKEALANVDPTADIVVLTNSDISLTADFYNIVADYFNRGITSINIHRDTVPDVEGNMAPIEAVNGPTLAHEGSDCWVFTPENAKEYFLGDLALGMSPVDDVMLINMRLHDASFTRLVGERLTFHFGDERLWKKDIRNNYFPQSFLLAKRALSELILKHGDSNVFSASFDSRLFLDTWRYVILPAMFPGQAFKFYKKWSREVRLQYGSKVDLFLKISNAQLRPSLKDRVRELARTPIVKLILQMNSRLR